MSFMVSGCQFPFYAQIGPQMSALLVAPPDRDDPFGFGTVGLNLEAGILYF